MEHSIGEHVEQDQSAVASRRRGELEFRRLLERLPAGAYTCDPQGLITYYNQHAVGLWGRAPRMNHTDDRFCGSFRLFSADGDPIQHNQCWMALALQNNNEYNGQEIIVQRPSGERLTVLANANPIRDASGVLIGAVNVLVDITDRKRAENALREADRSKDEFLATLAHELRNPLAPIRNAIEILHAQNPPTAEAKWAVEVIDRQMRQLTRLVDDLLDISRITRNKLEMRMDRTDLADALRSAVETSRPLFEAAGHQFVVDYSAEPIFLRADATRLAQAVSNLLNNAAKFTESGGRIWLHAARQGNEAVISVRDTGIGITPDMLMRVFDIFAQGDYCPQRAQGGLGIGLTLTRRLIALHGGTVEAQSAGTGKGSEFLIRLPVVIEPVQEPSPQGAGSGLQGSARGLRVLVVDDYSDSLHSLAMLLRLTGHEPRTASNGAEAVAIAEEFRPDVVLLDIGMPVMDGFEAARRLRLQAWGRQMVLIALTGWGQESDRQRARDAGFDHHIVKPVKPGALLQMLATIELPSA